jgi:hypothetical protein
LKITVDRAIAQLARIDESLVVHSNGVANRVLSHVTPTQRDIAAALSLDRIAAEMGTTLLPDPK